MKVGEAKQLAVDLIFRDIGGSPLAITFDTASPDGDAGKFVLDGRPARAIHHFDGISAGRNGACFVGSYSHHIHPGRRARQDALLGAAAATLGLTVYDRNSDRGSAHYRYPLLPGMRTRNWGRIINIASVHGLVGSTGKAAYVAAKHGVVGLTKVVGLETATSNVTCNAICPGWVLTPLVQKQIDDRAANGGDPLQAQHDLLAEKQPSLAFVTPEHLGELVLFLCSEAGSQVRGAAWNVDGGWLAQ